MTDIEQRLSETLRHVAGNTDVSHDALDVMAQRWRDRQRHRRGLRVAAVAAGVVALVAGAVGIWAFTGETARAPGVDVAANPEVLTGDAPQGWERARLAGAFGADACTEGGDACGRVTDMVFARTGFVAAGTDGSSPVVARSDDGRSWEPTVLPLPDEGASGRVAALAVGGDGRLVAVGGVTPVSPVGEGPLLAAWYSDDGEVWRLAEDASGDLGDAAVTDVARYGGGFVATAVSSAQDRTRLQLLTSTDGTSWQPGPVLTDLLPGADRYDAAGVASGAGVVVFAATGGDCGQGTAVWYSPSKDELPTATSTLSGTAARVADDPASNGYPETASSPSRGLEQTVPWPCAHITRYEQTDGAREVLVRMGVPSRSGPTVTWQGADPVLWLHEPTHDGLVQRHYVPRDDRWVDHGPVFEEESVELAALTGTDGARIAVAPIDGDLPSGAGGIAHTVGDGTGAGLQIRTSQDGSQWTLPAEVSTPAPGSDRAGSADLSRVEIRSDTSCDNLPDGPAYGVSAAAAGTDRMVIAGFATDCVFGAPSVPAIWVGPLP